MLCFEIYRNKEKICTAGMPRFGVLSAVLSSVSHSPEKMAQWAAEGLSAEESKRIAIAVEGLESDSLKPPEHLQWVDLTLAVGDEIRIRLAEAPSADPPSTRYRNDPVQEEQRKKDYVLRLAKEFGWEIRF